MSASLIADEIRHLRRTHKPEEILETEQDSSGRIKHAKVEGFTVFYEDRPSLNTAIKDIFRHRIYHIACDSSTPYIIDAGAHIGISMLYFKREYPGARVLCIEPDSEAVKLLRMNIDVNELAGIEILHAAVAETDGAAGFIADGSNGGRMIPRDGVEVPGSATCRTVRLSGYIDSGVDLLKLNIEGMELPVLRELDTCGQLQRIRRVILEYHGWPGSEQRLGEILQILSENGFRYLLHDFDSQTNPATKPPFRLRNAPWFCLVYAERPDGEIARKRPESSKAARPLAPVSRLFGMDRGTPIDRHYIEQFLARRAELIRGRAMEVADDTYIRKFGGDKVTSVDIVHAPPGTRRSTIVADIAKPGSLPASAFDVILLTQTLHCIYDMKAVVENLLQALRPGGVVLATLPGISQISRYDMERWGDYWRFTSRSAKALFEHTFGFGNVEIAAHGNVLVASGFLQGHAAEEFLPRELDYVDRDYELLITVAARRAV